MRDNPAWTEEQCLGRIDFIGAFDLAHVIGNDAELDCAGKVLILQRLCQMNQAIEANNVAMGGLMGLMSLMVGMINAACLS